MSAMKPEGRPCRRRYSIDRKLLADHSSKMLTFGMVSGPWGFDPLILLLTAMIAEAVIGEARLVFRIIPHPVAIIGGLADILERKLNRDNRSQVDRAFRGAFVLTLVVVLCLAVGLGVVWISQSYPYGWVLEQVLLITLLAQRSLYSHVRRVAIALETGGVADGRTAVAHIVGRDPQRLDGHGVARATIESCAENFSDGVVAPIFWYVLFGFPGILIYKAVNTLDSMIGHRSDRYRAFGFTAARLDDVLNVIPARIAGLLLVLAALFTPATKPGRALKTMLRDGAKHRSPNAGWPEAAAAGALGVALGGPRFYAEGAVAEAWMGEGSAALQPSAIRRMLYLYAVACLLTVLLVTLLVVLRLMPLN
jgi:adenosylcobinamide-phosphate synthase